MTGTGGLTAKRERFCREYLVDGNGSQAAIRAGYAKSGAEVEAYRLLRNAQVVQRIAELRKPIEEKLELSAERVLLEIKRLAYANPSDYYEFNGKGDLVPKPLHSLTENQARAIRRIIWKKPGVIEDYELYNKDPSLDKLGRNLKLFTDLSESVNNISVMGSIETKKPSTKAKGTSNGIRATLSFEIGQGLNEQ